MADKEDRTMRPRTIGWAVLAVLVLGGEVLALPLLAQHEAAAIYQPVTIYDVKDGDVIDAPLPPKSEGPITGIRQATLPSLIKVRQDFKEKVLQSGVEL
jgi:hypothetical protein